MSAAVKCQHCGADQVGDARFCGVCGRATSSTQPTTGGAPPAAAAELTGREIGGRFRILAKLGEGGMGAVYRGEQISLKRKVAVKLLRPELSRDPAIVRRFNAEAEAVAKLNHPNTVAIFDFGQDADGTLFIAMEYCEGRSLRQELTHGPMAPARALHIAAQVAASLSDAHRHGIVHRDLKPDNVMLTERGKDKDVVRVLDFGIAKLRDENRGTVMPMTQAGDLVGTPQYMAPEQIRGEHVDGRTDVYALGAIIYEMVTGRMLVEGPTVMAILSRHLLEMPEPPTRRRPDLAIPPPIDALTMEMLAKDPQHRVASMEAVTDRITALQAQVGGAAPVPTPARAMSRPPGVPQTLPPGVVQPFAYPPPPPPSQAMPVAPQAHVPTHMHGGYYAPPPHVQTPPVAWAMTNPPNTVRPAPTGGGSKALLWVVLGLLIVGGLVGVFLLMQRGKDDAAESGPPPEGDVVDLSGWKLTLPPGFVDVPGIVPEAKTYMGTINGNNAGIVAIAVPEDTSAESVDDFADGCEDIVRTFFSAEFLGGNLVDGAASQRYRCEFTSGLQQGEGRIYSVSGSTLVVFFAADAAAYASTYDARRELFDRRIKAP